jgi:hypothetical protein
MVSAFARLLLRAWANLLSSLGTSGLAVTVFSIAVPVCSFAASILYLGWRHGRSFAALKDTAKTLLVPATGITIAVTGAAWTLLFGFSVIRTVYYEHGFLTKENARLQTELNDRTHSLRLTDPATGTMFQVIRAFGLFRRHIGEQASCLIRITAPNESQSTALMVAQLAWVGTFCQVFGPVDINRDPGAEKEAISGMQHDLVVFHMAKGQHADALYADLGTLLRLKRSYEVPKGSPDNFLWLQFGTGRQWSAE